jgi:hypothetical protein
MPTFAARVDENQPRIVEVLRGAGATVLHLHTLGKGAPDICAGFRGRNFLMEIKNGNKPPSKRKLTADESAFFDTWAGQVSVVNDENEALQLIGAVDNE